MTVDNNFNSYLKLMKTPTVHRKIIAIIFAGVSSLFSTLSPADSLYSFGIEYGNRVDNVDVVQLLVTRNVSQWFDERIFDAGGRGIDTELAITAFHWSHRENDLNGASVGLRFIYEFQFLKTGKFTPHFEYALGTALLYDTVIGPQNLSTAFQFKNQLGLGFRTRHYDVFVRASHLSNASIKQPNDGLNILTVGLLFKF